MTDQIAVPGGTQATGVAGSTDREGSSATGAAAAGREGGVGRVMVAFGVAVGVGLVAVWG